MCTLSLGISINNWNDACNKRNLKTCNKKVLLNSEYNEFIVMSD